MSIKTYILSLTSVLSLVFSQVVTLYRSFKNHNTGEALVSSKVIEEIEKSPYQDNLLKELYDLK